MKTVVVVNPAGIVTGAEGEACAEEAMSQKMPSPSARVKSTRSGGRLKRCSDTIRSDPTFRSFLHTYIGREGETLVDAPPGAEPRRVERALIRFTGAIPGDTVVSCWDGFVRGVGGQRFSRR